MRSRLQHAWATTVETVGIFLKQALKSNQGEAEWLRFFALMGSALAIREGTPRVPGTPEDDTVLMQELRQLCKRLDVANRLAAYGFTVEGSQTNETLKKGYYFLLVSDPVRTNVRIYSYGQNDLKQATDKYLAEEKRLADDATAEAVLVSVESFQKLRRAYPNYFSDTKLFAKVVRDTLAGELV